MKQNLLTIIKDVGRCMVLCVPLLALSALSSCTNDEDVATPSSENQKQLMFSATVDDGWTEATRGERIDKELQLSFGVFCYTYASGYTWENNNHEVVWTPNMMCDQEVAVTAQGWTTTSMIYPPATGSKMQYFAYYPFRDPELADQEIQFLQSRPQYDPEANEGAGSGTPGNPQFQFYTFPNAIDQFDFLAGVSTEQTMPSNADVFFQTPVKLKFQHMLGGVIFKVGTFNEQMTIDSIRITQVRTTGTLTITPPTNADFSTATYSWALEDDKNSMLVSPNFKVVGNGANSSDVGQVINTGEQVMFLIPQTLPTETSEVKGAQLEVVINGDITLSAPIDGAEIQRGKITVFTLSVSSLAKLQVKSEIVPWGEGLTFSDDVQSGNAIIPRSSVYNWEDDGTATWEYDETLGATVLKTNTIPAAD